MPDIETVTEAFILHAIQEWGASDVLRIAAVQGVLDQVGFLATATCWPVFGRIWTKACTGVQAVEATEWLQQLTDTMKRGHFEDEVAHVVSYIKEASIGHQ